MAASIVKQWALTSSDGHTAYGFQVMDDGTLWLVEGKPGTGAVVQVGYYDIEAVMPDMLATLATVNAALALDPIKKTITSGGSTITLSCDLPVNHAQSFHHDPTLGMYWVSDA